MKKRLFWLGISVGVLLSIAFTAHTEFGMIEIPCRKCYATGNCQTCGGDKELKKTCVACLYSGNCQKCGGTKVEVISREEAFKQGYR